MGKDKKLYKREIPLDGKLITWDDPTKIGQNFQQLTNLRYTNTHPKGIGGMSAITSAQTDLVYNKIKSAIHYTKDQPSESHVLAQAFNSSGSLSLIYQNTTAIPNAGNFNTGSLPGYVPSGSGIGRWSEAPDGDIAYCDEAENCAWGGDEREIAGFINYDPSDTFSYDYTERVRNTQTDVLNKAVLHLVGTAAYIYVGSIRPLDGFKLYIGTANTGASTMTADYWNGAAWTSTSGLVDGTKSGGKSLAQTGNVTFSSTANSAKLKHIDGTMIYWYRIIINVVSANTSIYYVTASAPLQSIKDIWDGVQRQIDSFQIYHDWRYDEYTINVREKEYIDPPNYEESDYNAGNFVNIDRCSIPLGSYFVCGFMEPMVGVMINFAPDYSNQHSIGLYVEYWNGTTWVSVDSIEDGTYSTVGGDGPRTFANTGTITWNIVDIENEYRRSIFNDIQLYYYRFRATNTPSENTRIYYVTGIPAQKQLSKYKFPLMSNDRLWLCCDVKGKKNTVICSATETSCVFNGEDSAQREFGSESELIGGSWVYSQYGSTIYYTTFFFKKDETWVLVGNNPEDWTKYKISNSVGCVAPGTIKNVDLGPESNMPNRSVVIWQGANGIYMSDGRTPMLISTDIQDKFDKRLSTSINLDKIADSEAFWDNDNNCYHWLWASGTSTLLNEECVFDFEKMAWFEINRTSSKDLQLGIEVKDVNGNTYNYAFNDSGYMFRLEHGNDFDGHSIFHALQFGDIALAEEGSVATETVAEYSSLIATAKTDTDQNIIITHYGDGCLTGNSWAELPSKSGYRIIYPVEHKSLGAYIFHSYRFVILTNNETVGFEPLYFYTMYSIARDHTRDYR